MRFGLRLLAAAVVGCALGGAPILAFATGALHSVYGAVNYSGGDPPMGWPELQFHACIIGKPDTLWSGPNGGTTAWYDGQYCWARIQCAEFDPPWQDGDLLHVFLWGNGANNPPSFLPEACSVWLELDAAVTEQSMEGLWGLSLAQWFVWNLRADLVGGELRLIWSPIPGEGMHVSVYRDTTAHFYPDILGGTNWVGWAPGSTGVYLDSYGVGDPEVNAFYSLRAHDYIFFTNPGDVSEAVGEFDYSTATASSEPPPHIVCGTVHYSDGTIPTIDGEVTFCTYIATRPEEVLTETDPGCASFYSHPDYWVIIQCGTFRTPWSVGELLHIDFWLDGASHGGVPEFRQLEVVLDGQPVQDWGIWWP